MLIFGDFETSGLDPEQDIPLEFGIVLYDPATQAQIARSFLIQWPSDAVQAVRDMCHPVVREMHTKNGLWAELLGKKPLSLGTRPVAPEAFDATLCALATELWPGTKHRLAGFNPGFDLRWLMHWAPEFAEKHLHYGVFDVSTIRESVAIVYPNPWGPSRTDAHRGVADCQAAIAYWQWYRVNVMNPHHRRP